MLDYICLVTSLEIPFRLLDQGLVSANVACLLLVFKLSELYVYPKLDLKCIGDCFACLSVMAKCPVSVEAFGSSWKVMICVFLAKDTDG